MRMGKGVGSSGEGDGKGAGTTETANRRGSGNGYVCKTVVFNWFIHKSGATFDTTSQGGCESRA